MKTKHGWMTLFILFVIVALAACGEKTTPVPAPVEVPTATVEPFLQVGSVTEPLSTLVDHDSGYYAGEKRVTIGDNFLDNLFERPFTSNEMVYQPDVNILAASLAEDENFFYFTLAMHGLDPTASALLGTYGIEFDRTKTGRGDLLITTHDLTEEWLTDNVKVFTDTNGDVGGVKPIVAEAGQEYQGYEGTLEMEGDKVAYARLVPGEPTQVQIAVSRMLLDNPEEFLWGGWADRGVNDPLLFDYDDHFGPSEAGSPVKASADYPLAALYSVDNTCRKPYGFEQGGNIPGMCKTGSPTEPEPEIPCTWICTGILQGGICYRGEWVCK